MGPKKTCFPLLLLTVFSLKTMLAQENKQIVRLAKLVIDSSRLQDYKAALKEEIETSVRLEPGVLTLCAVQEKDNPSRMSILEIYADANAYKIAEVGQLSNQIFADFLQFSNL